MEAKYTSFVGRAVSAGRFVREGLANLLWPGVCHNCGEQVSCSSDFLCDRCWADLQTCTAGDCCPRCGRDASGYGLIEGRCGSCVERELEFEGIVRVGVYSGVLRDILLRFKFNDGCELAGRLGGMASDALNVCSFSDQIECLVPVPLFWMRKLSRGYNQSELICRNLGGRKTPISNDLVRIRNTDRQYSLTPSKRKKNVAGAFAVRKDHGFAGKKICLVDDIITSGATLNECASVLRQAGAERVYAMVIAVAAQDGREKS